MVDEFLKRKTTIDACQELAQLVARHTDSRGNGVHSTAIAQLELMRESVAPTALRAVYEPTLCIVVQGRKETLLGQETYHYGAAQYLVVTVDLPLSGNIVEATPDKPYLCFKLSLNATELWHIIDQLQRSPNQKESSVRGLFVSDANVSLIECATRLTRHLDTPEDIPFLAPMMIRELYYRLLMGEQNEAVWQIATSGSYMQRIAEVIFTIRLPLMKTQALSFMDGTSADTASSEGNALAGIRILVVDDEADMRDLIVAILEQSGAIVQVAASAFEALAVFDPFQPMLLVSDIGMSEADGYELMQQVKSRFGKLPAIALTAYAMEQDQQQAFSDRFQRHIAKPIDPVVLVKAIVALISQEQP